ncbi:MAG: TatD family hydrolase [Duncaniella sp.]|nr:TatD family hydrolase [Duncaniella sp.]
MRLIDTHTHIYLPEFDTDRAEVTARAIESGVEKMILPNVDLTTLEPMKNLRASRPDSFFMAVGLHPTEVKSDWREQLDVIESELRENPSSFVAIGEVGIDLYWDKTFVAEQKEALHAQFLMALKHNLPVIIHCRKGLNEIIEVLQSLPLTPRCVFHSFGGDATDVMRLREIGDFYFGINGIVTFKNSRLREVLPVIGIERILLETDAPYLAPVPFRGKRNEPSYVAKVAEYVAGVFNMPVDDVAEITSANAERFFGI